MSSKRFWGILILILAIAGLLVFVRGHKTPAPSTQKQSGSLTSLNTGSAPWPVESAHLANRMQAIGLPLLSAEGTALHIHAHLDIYIHGKQQTVPAEIGVISSGISPVHTHDTSGIIHVESPDANAVYTLGQFFDIWGVRLTDDSIGGYKADATNKFVVYDNGTAVAKPTDLSLSKHHEIVVTYGTTAEQPNIPATYTFPDGL